MKKLSRKLFISILTFPLCTSVIAQQKPGSGNAINFNGINNYVEIPNNTSLNLAAYTVECWVRILSNSGTVGGANSTARYIIFKQRPTVNYFEYITLAYYIDGAFRAVTTSPSNSQVVCAPPSGFVSFNKWYHLAVTADDKNLSFYVMEP
jgi:hypothetical protein